jgi:hypothetical protein
LAPSFKSIRSSVLWPREAIDVVNSLEDQRKKSNASDVEPSIINGLVAEAKARKGPLYRWTNEMCHEYGG